MLLSDNINRLMVGAGISNIQLGKEIGVSDVMVGQWRKGKSIPALDKAAKIAEYFGVTLDELMGKPLPTGQMVTLPLVGAINAGAFTIENEEEWKEFRDVTYKSLHGRNKKECVLLEVVGESMEPLVHCGEILIVHRQLYAVNGNIVIAYDPNEGGYTVKRFKQNGDTIILEPANEKYKTYKYINPTQQELRIYGICMAAERSLL